MPILVFRFRESVSCYLKPLKTALIADIATMFEWVEERLETTGYRLIGVAYTSDVDTSVAGYSSIPGFGSFDLTISGNLTAIVGQNGSGKSRFLDSIGKQTELLFAMPTPIEPKSNVAEALHRPYSQTDREDALQPALWGLDTRTNGSSHDSADRPWLVPEPFDGENFIGTRMIWQQQPRDRFKRFRSLVRGGQKPPWGPPLGRLHPHENYFHDDEVLDEFAQKVWRAISRLDRRLRINAAHAATAMYPFDHSVGADHFQDTLIAGAGVELAKYSVVGLTGCETGEGQKLRFWFEADWQTRPCLTALLATLPHVGGMEGGGEGRQDLLDSADSEQLRVVLEVEHFDNICFASANSGLLPHPGSPRHFTPQLPLRLNSDAGVLHENSSQPSWLEGFHAPNSEVALLQEIEMEIHPCLNFLGCFSWRLARAMFLPNVSPTDDELLHDEEFVHDEGLEIPGNVPLLIPGVLPRSSRDVLQERWQSSIITAEGGTHTVRSSFVFGEDVSKFIQLAVKAVNRIASVILPDPPMALADLSTGALHWRYVKGGPMPRGHRDTLALEDLSFAERRWMKFANLIAGRFLDRVLTEFGDEEDRSWVAANLRCFDGGVFAGTPFVVTIDEPESGLHPTAVDRLARGLEALGSQLGIHFVFATHSPNVLKIVQGSQGLIAHAHLSDEGERVFEAIDSARLNEFAGDLGLNPIDILQMTSTFLLVEGEHDRIVINNIIGDDIKRAGVVITPLRGALKVSQIVDSDILWRFTDARLVLVLDSIDADQFQKILQSAKNLVGTGDLDAAIDALEPLKRDRSDKGKTEREALYGLLRSAVTSRRIDRLEIFGLKEPDIIDYFHPSELGNVDPGSHYVSMSRRDAWDALHKDYMQTPKKERAGDFKSWAVAKLGLNDSPTQVLQSASENIDRIPDDFNNLRELLCSLSPTERHAH